MILAIDPGDTSGLCYYKSAKDFKTFTIYKDFNGIAEAIKNASPSLVVFERFVLYPATALSLAYNDMYTSQVIGVIKYICDKEGIPYYTQSASNKDYVIYPKKHIFKTEHEKDAYGHAWYFQMNNKYKKR